MQAVSPDEEYLRALLAQAEHRNLEFKAAVNSFSSDKAMEYCAGIANAGGGTLLLGITDERQVVGTAAFPDPRQVELRAHEALGIRVLTRELRYQDKRVLALTIPPRGPGVPVAFDGRYFLRTGESLVRMTAHQLAEIFAETRGRASVRAVLENLTAERVDDLIDVDAYFRLMSLPRPASLAEALTVLAGKDLVLTPASGLYSITAVGALFLARDMARFPGMEWRRIRFLKYAENDRVTAVVEHFETRGYGLCFEETISLIQGHVGVQEIIEGGRRETRPLYPPTAIREFLANALVHQDLTESGVQITVEVFADRMEIRNPGLPLIDVTRFVDDSRSRNPELAEIMRLAGICEVRGSGVDRALTQIESLLRPAPEFRAESGATSVVLYGERHFDDMTIEERAWAAFLHSCVRYVAGDGLTNSSLRERFGLPQSKAAVVSQTIAAAIDRDLIKLDPRVGSSKRHAKYQPFFA